MRIPIRAMVGLLLLVAMLAGPTIPLVSAQAPSPTGPSVVGGEGVSEAVAARIDELIAAVPALRDLQPTEAVPYRAIDKPTFRLELEGLFDEQYPPELLAAEEAAWQRLGLLRQEDDLRTLILDLLGDQALAYYDPRTRTITFVGDLTEIGAAESIIVVHEYAHALQDQRWDLEGSRIKDPSRSDAILAETALTEGDATLVMFEWAAQNLGLDDLLRVSERALSRSDLRLLERTPPLLRRQLVEFPYLDGYAFVNAIRGRGQGWQAVDGAWDARPASTEQVLHPERYPTDVPVDVVLPDVAARLGEGWAPVYEQTLGEMQMGVWVADGRQGRGLFGLPGRLPRAEAVEGWGGDRLVSLEGPDGSWTLVWQTVWDSEADAREFLRAARSTMRDLPGAHDARTADISGSSSSGVLVLIADDESTLDEVRTAVGVA
jgi:hypothetical protein